MTGADAQFCPDQEITRDEWTRFRRNRAHDWWDREKSFKQSLAEMWISPVDQAVHQASSESVGERFVRLADDWARNTMYTSSATSLINDENYQQIIRLGWDVVPFLLNDMESSGRFWFPALAAITGIRPFDPIDSSNYQRMKSAWLRWGKRKGLI